MDAACLVPLNSIKNLMGYQPYETAVLLVIFNKIKNPEITLAKADKLHSALQPKPAIIYGSFKHNEHTAQGTALGFKNDKASIDVYSKYLTILKGDLKNFSTKEEKVIVGKSLADTLQVDIGDTVTLSYETRFEGPSPDSSYKVAAVVSDEKGQYNDTVFLNEPDLHKIYFEHLPQKTGKFPNAFVPGKDSEIFPAIALSYKLLDRTNSFQELEKKTREFRRKKWKGNITDVVCMQEVADMALKLEATLNIISLITVLILFFIILIGVVNTLRMAVRERTREIGTVRAIGMQKNQVSRSFIMESVFLSLFASIAGIVAGFIVMHLISLMTFNPENLFSIFLDEGHVHFLYNLKTISGDLMLIVIITILTAYFPARRAANLSVAHALGHYE
jgi:ABC-type antimicrobial peptide transport system permease subunit